MNTVSSHPVDTGRPSAIATKTPECVEREVNALSHASVAQEDDRRSAYIHGALHALEWLFDDGRCLPPSEGVETFCKNTVIPGPIPERAALIELPFVRACILKWNAGRMQFGDDFVGEPLPELFGELVDSRNYADQAVVQGVVEAREFGERIQELALEVQGLHELRTKGSLEARV